jgi:RNA recognition motif-containing protein
MRPPAFKPTIIVSNLPEGFTAEDLASLFDEYGLVLGAMIKPGDDGGKAPRGLVNLAPANAVGKAVQSLDGQVVQSRHLRVRKAPEPPPKAPKVPRRTMVVRRAQEQFPAEAAPARARRPVVVERRSLPSRSRPS